MSAYPYAAKRANARRWLNAQRAIAELGNHWVLATPQPRLPPKRLQGVPRELFYEEVPAFLRRQAD